MEVSTLKQAGHTVTYGKAQILRLQSDERLVTLIRKGNHAAFEALVSRYQPRLFSFCRHMLNSKEDAEDILQEVFAASYNAILTDEREINARPWLYRIARNRCLNHMRRVQHVGVDSMDVHLSDEGITTADRVHSKEDFRLLMEDVKSLPETQRTALLLREIDALSYEQIAEAMESTVPSVKSLLVRARVALAESAEARLVTCEEARIELGEVAEGLMRMSPPVKRHIKDCERCRNFKKQLDTTNKQLAAIMPIGPMIILKKFLVAKLGSTAASSATVAGSTAASNALTTSLSAVASKALAGVAAAAIVTVGTAEFKHATVNHTAKAPAPVAQAADPISNVPLTSSSNGAPQPVSSSPQPAVAEKPKKSKDDPQPEVSDPTVQDRVPSTTSDIAPPVTEPTPTQTTPVTTAPQPVTTAPAQEDSDVVPLPDNQGEPGSDAGGAKAPSVPVVPTNPTPTTVEPTPTTVSPTPTTTSDPTTTTDTTATPAP